jgi:hypothetical protein
MRKANFRDEQPELLSKSKESEKSPVCAGLFVCILVRPPKPFWRISQFSTKRCSFHDWRLSRLVVLNERQRTVLQRILGNFEGDLNLRKYRAISNAPRATAQRDLSDLVDRGILISSGAGKATKYHIVQRGVAQRTLS